MEALDFQTAVTEECLWQAYFFLAACYSEGDDGERDRSRKRCCSKEMNEGKHDLQVRKKGRGDGRNMSLIHVALMVFDTLHRRHGKEGKEPESMKNTI